METLFVYQKTPPFYDDDLEMIAQGRHLLALPASDLAALAPAEEVLFEPFSRRGVRLFIKRDDTLHPVLSGNKLYKLWGHYRAADNAKCHTLASCGGYYSNHLHALAYLGLCSGFQTIGYVRGHKPNSLSPTLLDCQTWGMELRFLSRLDYRVITQTKQAGMNNGVYFVPEGGGGDAGQLGCQALGAYLAKVLPSQATLCLAVGTGTTLSGVMSGLRNGHCLVPVQAFSALKLGDNLSEFKAEISPHDSGSFAAEFDLTDEWSFGGFGKTSPNLLTFMTQFETQTQILLDPIYTGKMLYGLTEQVNSGIWPEGHQLVVLHSGGLQGRRGVFF